MARKLLIVIFIFTLAALSLLAIRQEQINTVHTMTVLHQQIARQETSLDALRFAIEEECSVESLGLFLATEVAKHE
ncbi:MAG: hypothetical protein HOC93_03740 [Phycisphaerae bacterium]|jgi:cell division protein FtsL|nr:hypothetical protein [Phycisphaerae bacterium]HJN71547.1 hypothetical protein [Phycisphaerales bacterium]|tara:strand:+ start:5345 stop:5572 length:228 start_codon:yes stop_codon:yes gene_type:complete